MRRVVGATHRLGPVEPAANGTRERILEATFRLLQRHGYEGMAIKQIAGEAGAALGSVYHFFPGGKEELAAEAIRAGGHEFAGTLRTSLDSETDPGKAVVACTRALAADLRKADWVAGCSFATTAIETADGAPQVRLAISEAVERWQSVVAERLFAGGLRKADARDLAYTLVCVLEGATLACQTARDDKPLRLAGKHFARLIASYR